MSKGTRIDMSVLEQTIKNTKPTVPASELQKFDAIRAEMEGEKKERRRVGF
jgi:hypothetical protein